MESRITPHCPFSMIHSLLSDFSLQISEFPFVLRTLTIESLTQMSASRTKQAPCQPGCLLRPPLGVSLTMSSIGCSPAGAALLASQRQLSLIHAGAYG